MALAQKIAANAPMSNFAVMQALPRIAELSQAEGLFVESLMAAIAAGRRPRPRSACAPSSTSVPARWRRDMNGPRYRAAAVGGCLQATVATRPDGTMICCARPRRCGGSPSA
jgi:hypothetical protein